jgi:hypothetical protein
LIGLAAKAPIVRNKAPSQHVVGGVESQFGARTDVARGERCPERRRNHAHLADAGIGEHGLRILLRDANRDAVEGRKEADRHERASPTLQGDAERQEADEPDHSGLDRRAAQHGRSRNRRRRIGERHPAVQRDEAHLHAEAGYDEGDRRIAPRRSGQRRNHIFDAKAAVRLARREHGEGQEQQGLAEDGEGHVNAAGAPRRRRIVGDDHSIGRNADKSIDEIKRQEIARDKDAEAADHGQEPANREALIALRPFVQENAGADDDP